MGALCGKPMDKEPMTGGESSNSMFGSRKNSNKKDDLNGIDLTRKTSMDFGGSGVAPSAPRIHKARNSRLYRRGSAAEGSEFEWRNQTTIADASDEQLLIEVRRRKINIHERVTKDLVEQKYTFGRLLGQGASGSVYQAKHKASGRDVAIKVIKRDNDMNDDDSMSTELEILRTVRHRYLLNCHELFESPHCIWVVMELIRGGELLETLIEQGTYQEQDASRAMKQVLMAVRYLHSQGIVHRDLKLQNLLLTEKDITADTKIADFGLSAVLPRGEFDPSDGAAMKAFGKLRDRWGTPHYFAPEMVKKAYGPQVDLWALGVVLYQLLVGRLPFNGQDTHVIFEQILDTKARLEKLMKTSAWNGVSEAAKDFLKKLLEPDPNLRLSADEALNHPWIALKGEGGGNLAGAYDALKQEVAKRRIADMWHVLDIMNSLEAQGAATPTNRGSVAGKRGFHPALISQVSVTGQGESSEQLTPPPGGRKRQISKTDMLEELQSVFNLFDRDGNGTIDVEELCTLMKKLGFNPNEDKVREIVVSVDANSNGQLEFDEFCEFLKVAKSGIGIGNALEDTLIKGFDKNGDGYVESKDIKEMMQALGEHIGMSIPQNEIDQIIALSETQAADHNGQARTQDLVQNMMMNSAQRKALMDAKNSSQSNNSTV